VAFFFDYWYRDRHSRGFLSDDDEGNRQEKGSLSAIADFYVECPFAREFGERAAGSA
jgi:hypothetical protein